MSDVDREIMDPINEAVTECFEKSIEDVKAFQEKSTWVAISHETIKEMILHLFDARYKSYRESLI